MPSARVAVLTKDDIVAAAQEFRGRGKTKWTVIVEGKELPARPLILHAAGVPPNDPTNSHQAVAILANHGFDVRYEGKTIENQSHTPPGQSASLELIHSLRGSAKGENSLLEAREREHRIEKNRLPDCPAR